MNLFKHDLTVNKAQNMLKITQLIREDIKESGIMDGIVVVYSPHTTAGLTINENADPDVIHDMIYGLEMSWPTNDSNYRHFEGNSHAHLKASSMGASVTLILEQGKLVLGTWQEVYFCEYDGPRNRCFYVKILAG